MPQLVDLACSSFPESCRYGRETSCLNRAPAAMRRFLFLLLPLSLLPALAVAQANWQAPAISAAPPSAVAPAAPAKPASQAAAAGSAASAAKPSATAAATARPATGAAVSATTPAATTAAQKKPASSNELASRIVERLEQAKTDQPAPKARAQIRHGGQGDAASSFLTPAELRARIAAQSKGTTSAAATPPVSSSPPARPRLVPKAQPVSLAPKAGPHAQPSHWAYEGEGGPEHWARLSPEFARCGTGRRQSPIDIRDGLRLDLEVPVFEYQPSRFSVLDNGHTIQVDLLSPNFLSITGRRYELQQFHFHRPSEERVDGRGADMVAHLVHRDPQGRLAVVAVLIEPGTPHEAVQMVWNNLPLEKNETVTPSTLLDLAQLLPARREYYTYMGSLTTPPCTEGVLWIVMKQPLHLSEQQIRIFARLYPMNARPVQAAWDRLIKESN